MNQHEYRVDTVDSSTFAAFFRFDGGRHHCAVCDLEQITVSIFLGIPLLHPGLSSLPTKKISFVLHFEASVAVPCNTKIVNAV
jgi:hypothetical protein